MILSPRESGEYVTQNAKFVKVQEPGIVNVVREVSFFYKFE